MLNLFVFEGSLAGVFRNANQPGAVAYGEDDLVQALESAVDGTEPKIRLIGGYRKRLLDPVEAALRYVDRMVDQIPGAIEISRETFTSDPRVHAFFSSLDDMHDVLSRSSELWDFLEARGYADDGQCCALMCMKRTERAGFGMDISGDQVRRDVPQTTVSFSDHQITAPAVTEEAARLGLKDCIYKSLVTNALDRISACRATSGDIDTQRRSLHSRLRSLEARLRRNQLDVIQRQESEQQMRAIESQIAQLDEGGTHAGCAGPEDWLEQLCAVLSNPESCVRLQNLSLRLNMMGVKLGSSADEVGDEIQLAEIEMGADDNRRVVALVRFPRSAVGPRRDFVLEAGRYLAI